MTASPPPLPARRRARRVVVWVLGLLVLVFLVCSVGLRVSGVGRQGSYGTFGADGVPATVQIPSEQRMPDWFDGEEYVYAQLHRGGSTSHRLEIDVNGQFGNTLRVDLSRDGRWARISRTLPGGFAPFAYTDFETDTVIRYAFATSTAEERDTLLRAGVPPIQEIRGQRIEWVEATKR